MIRAFALALLFPAFLASAEGTEETLLASDQIRSGGFGGPVVKFGPVNDQSAVLVGGRGGWLINSIISIGGGAYGLSNRVTADSPDSVRLQLGYGGLVLERVFMPLRMMHGSLSLLVGAGTVDMHESMHRDDRAETENFFVLEPEASLEINVGRFFRFCPGMSYRWLAGDSRYLDSDWDISGWTGNLTFKFGKF
jgi:hypothetical protein